MYRSEGFQALMKIVVEAHDNSGPRILAVLNVVDDPSIVGTHELGLSEPAFAQLGLPERSVVRAGQAEPPLSIHAVHRKIAGEILNYEDLRAITRDIGANRYSKVEIAAFLVASSQAGLEREEILSLTRAMAESGEKLEWGEPLVADKHCIGGIPGNRTSMVVVPIVAAHGMLIPKTSSRAITSPAGTADTMEVLARVDLEPVRLREIVQQRRGCITWGGTSRLAPVDDLLLSVERPLSLDSEGQMVASILSKKVAAGSTHLLIDIPVGPSAKVRHMSGALRLRKLFEYVGDRVGLHLESVITDGREPVGRGIGPVLEARDVLQVLQNDPEGPLDLREKALRLAGRILEFDPDVRGGTGYAMARDILDSGRAMRKMNEIIDAQGRQEMSSKLGRLHWDVPSPEGGVVTTIDNLHLARIARIAGAPIAKGAGVDLIKKLGDRVEKGEPLYRVYADIPANFRFARARIDDDIGYRVDKASDMRPLFGSETNSA
jgi:thymidine phosphorylase